MSQLHYETLLARREGVTRDLPAGDNEDLRWVANSATLIFGDHDAVLVDTFTTIEQNERLIGWVKAHGRTLTHIYLTHGHGDHVTASGSCCRPFPALRRWRRRERSPRRASRPATSTATHSGPAVPRPDPAAGDPRRTSLRHHLA